MEEVAKCDKTVYEEHMEKRIRNLRSLFEKEMTISRNLFLLSIISMDNKDLKGFLRMQGIYRTALYGLGKAGQVFLRLLRLNNVDVVYVVDKNPNLQADKIKVIHSVEEMTSDIDAVIVTSEFYFPEIKENIECYIDTRIILMRDLLDYVVMDPIPVR